MSTIAITGATSGIGLRAAIALAQQGHRVLALCRSVDRARDALGDAAEVIETHMDDLGSVEHAAGVVASRGVDALINNAAIFDLSMKRRRLSPDGHELVWATNHLGPTALAAHLAPALADARGRLIWIASKGLLAMPRLAVRWEDLDAEGWYTPTKAYYHAKLAQVMTAVTFAERLTGSVDVACLRVPAVRLDADKLAAQPWLQRTLYAPKNRAAAAPEEIAAVYARLANAGSGAEAVYVDERLTPCALPRFARDEAHRARLREVTEELIGVNYPA